MATSSPSDHPCYALLPNIPLTAGVYCMHDGHGRIVYIGKARNLRKRLSSYFRVQQISAKTAALMQHVQHIEVIVTSSEHEALLLEANLIKQHKPRYNVLLRDDKSFPYLYLDTRHTFPRLDFYRGKCEAKGRYFGPYPNAGAVREMLSWVQRLFRLRQCSDIFFKQRTRPCLQYQIKRCTAPCVGLVSAPAYQLQVEQASCFLSGKREQVIEMLRQQMQQAAAKQDYEQASLYRDQLQRLTELESSPTVSGGRGDADVLAVMAKQGVALVNLLLIRSGHVIGQQSFAPKITWPVSEEEVLAAFLAQYYLQSKHAQAVPERIILDRQLEDTPCLQDAIQDYCGHKIRLLTQVRGHAARWLQMAQANVAVAWQQHLQQRDVLLQQFAALQSELKLPNPIARIECFDISHTQGQATLAACVVCGLQGMQTKDYRRFNIQAGSITAGDDYAALKQAITRRYSKQKKMGQQLPDLLLIDGGKGQLTQAQQVLESLQVSGVWLLAIAKGPQRRAGEEKLFMPGKPSIQLKSHSSALHLLQRIRDEAHRFAITGHRAQRGRQQLQSILQQIPGVGPTRRQALLKHFSGIQGVKAASYAELCEVPGISRSLAQIIYDFLQQST